MRIRGKDSTYIKAIDEQLEQPSLKRFNDFACIGIRPESAVSRPDVSRCILLIRILKLLLPRSFCSIKFPLPPSSVHSIHRFLLFLEGSEEGAESFPVHGR